MKIAVTYSSKAGLLTEYKKRLGKSGGDSEIPADFFAEGDSPATIQAIIDTFIEGGHRVLGVEADDRLLQTLEAERPDFVFNLAEGLWGDFRESYVPLICERLGLPYSGSDPLTLAICLNKARTKEILGYHLIPTPAFRIFSPRHPVVLDGFEFPAIVKPVSEGSSKGIFNDSVVYSPADARRRVEEKIRQYQQPVLMERFLTGQEFTVAIWGNGEEVEVLPIIAMDYSQLPVDSEPIYSYEAKWIWDTPEKPLEIFQCPASISAELKENIEEVVRDTYRVLQVRDWCRIDVRLDEQEIPHVLELNPLPGILPDPKDNSCFPKAARTAGYGYREMLLKVLGIAAKRNGLIS